MLIKSQSSLLKHLEREEGRALASYRGSAAITAWKVSIKYLVAQRLAMSKATQACAPSKDTSLISLKTNSIKAISVRARIRTIIQAALSMQVQRATERGSMARKNHQQQCCSVLPTEFPRVSWRRRRTMGSSVHQRWVHKCHSNLVNQVQTDHRTRCYAKVIARSIRQAVETMWYQSVVALKAWRSRLSLKSNWRYKLQSTKFLWSCRNLKYRCRENKSKIQIITSRTTLKVQSQNWQHQLQQQAKILVPFSTEKVLQKEISSRLRRISVH